MIFKAPKTKTGQPLKDVTATYKLNNPHMKRWFVNDKVILVKDLPVILGYEYHS